MFFILSLYFGIGAIFAICCLIMYDKTNAPYSKEEKFIGALFDVLAWPVILFLNYIFQEGDDDEYDS